MNNYYIRSMHSKVMLWTLFDIHKLVVIQLDSARNSRAESNNETKTCVDCLELFLELTYFVVATLKKTDLIIFKIFTYDICILK